MLLEHSLPICTCTRHPSSFIGTIVICKTLRLSRMSHWPLSFFHSIKCSIFSRGKCFIIETSLIVTLLFLTIKDVFMINTSLWKNPCYFIHEQIIIFYLRSCVFPEFDWPTDYIHFVMKQNMAAALLLQKMFSCFRDNVVSFSTFFQQFASWNLVHQNLCYWFTTLFRLSNNW